MNGVVTPLTHIGGGYCVSVHYDADFVITGRPIIRFFLAADADLLGRAVAGVNDCRGGRRVWTAVGT